MPASSLRRNLRLCTYDGLAATPIVYLVQPGNFIIAALLVERFHLPPDLYGLIVSLPFWANFAQAFLMPFINTRLSPKGVSVTSSALQALCWVVLTLMISFLPVDRPGESGPWFLAIFAVSAIITSLTGVSWISWVQEWIPVRLRGKYFGRRNRLLQTAQVISLISASLLISHLTGSVRAFQWLLIGTILLRVASVLFQQGIKASTTEVSQIEAKTSSSAQLRALIHTPAFLWLVAYGAGWGFATSCFGPFYPLFMYNSLGFSVQHVGILIVLASLGGALSSPAWGVLADRFGNKPVMLFCMIIWQLENLLWCIITPGNAWLLYGMWIFGGIVNAGFALSLFNIQLKVIPPKAKTVAISVNLAVTSLVTAVAPIIGGVVLRHMLTGSNALAVYHSVFLVMPILALLSCFMLVKVHEPSASPLSSVVGAMRNIRTLSGLFGASFLVDYIFVKSSDKR
ncbi:MAG TPA: MFS transporter [Rariglobus sp.]|jgi:MFS family permease|nr:MFS transporter [Rariglobus sp.]